MYSLYYAKKGTRITIPSFCCKNQNVTHIFDTFEKRDILLNYMLTNKIIYINFQRLQTQI